MAYLETRGADSLIAHVPLFRTITRIGSDATSDLVLSDSIASAEHLQILLENDVHWLVNQDKKQSVQLNGKRVKRAKLAAGDTIEIGGTIIMYREGKPPVAHQPKSDQRLESFREIVNFSEKLLQRDDHEGLFQTLMDSVVELTQADNGFLLWFVNGKPEVRAARNLEQEDIPQAEAAVSDSVLSQVIKTQQPLIVSDARSDKDFSSSESVMSLRLVSVMCVPLAERGSLLGVIYLGSSRATHLFNEETLEAVTVFAAQGSLLLRNQTLLADLKQENLNLREAVVEKQFGTIIGNAPAMQPVFKVVAKVAPTDVSVLITGETGTGKELIARELHERSDRAEKPFVVLNCGAIPENLLESELFGHVKGSFTGAVQDREGRFEAADGGTLFLDEIGEMPMNLQVKLLRALQERTITRVGDTRVRSVDIRVISATHRNLEDAIKEGAFREDLYYRLNVVGIHLPSLREREDDVVLIARYLLSKYTKAYDSSVTDFAPQCLMVMKDYPWPGNIRQLENRIKKAVIMADGTHISADDMELNLDTPDTVIPLAQAKDEFQRSYINKILSRNGGNRTKTAHDLGVDPRTIFRHLEKEDG